MSTLKLLGARALRVALDRHAVRPDKSLGQNFVIDPNTIRKIVEIAGVSNQDRVLEIGAGAGSLTLGLAAVAARVVAVEYDRRLLPVLREIIGDAANVEVVEADARHLDFASFDANCLVANLPYNIATSVVLRALEEARQITELTVMTQKEVGERLVAQPGSKAYGQTSVMVRYFADSKVAARVSRNAFFPIPGVDSVVVRMVRREDVPAGERDRLFRVIRAGFSQRRKTLRNALLVLAGSADAAERAIRAAGLGPGTRAEDVDLAGWTAIAGALEEL